VLITRFNAGVVVDVGDRGGTVVDAIVGMELEWAEVVLVLQQELELVLDQVGMALVMELVFALE
jgi:hypothetical protein